MKPRLAALVLLTVTCSSGADDLAPQPGTWAFGASSLVDNSCGGDTTPTEPTGNFTLAATGDAAFSVKDPSFTDLLACSFDGDAFTCPESAAESNKPEPSVDATVTYNVGLSGTIVGATELSGKQTVELTCAGESCDLAASVLGVTQLPCAYAYDFNAATH